MSATANHPSLGHRAFSVFCDVTVRDIAEKNQQYRVDNSALAPFLKRLLTFQVHIYQSTENEDSDSNTPVTTEIDLSPAADQIATAEHRDSFEVDLTGYDTLDCPLEKFSSIHFSKAGFKVDTGNLFGMRPQLAVQEDGTIHVEINFNDLVSLGGVLEGYQGTLEDLKQTIATNRIAHYFSRMAFRGFRRPYGDTFDLAGTTIKFRKMRLGKRLVQVALELEERMNGASTTFEDRQSEELLLLSKAYPNNKELIKVTDDYRLLKARNECLREAKRIFKTVVVSVPYKSENMLCLDLEKGHMMNRFDEESEHGNAWIVDPKPEDANSFPVSSLSNLRIHLGTTALPGPSDQLFMMPGPFVLGNGAMLMELGFGVTAFFGVYDSLTNADNDGMEVDESSDESDVDGDGSDSSDGVIMLMVDGNEPPVMPRPEQTVSLLTLQIGLDVVQEHLELLGIDTSVSNEEEDDRVGAENDSNAEEQDAFFEI